MLKRKSFIRRTIITLGIILLIGGSISFGVGYDKQITAWFYNIQVKLDGNSLNFSNEPFIYDGRVYIPLRDVSENLGLNVTWDGDTKTVYLANNGAYNPIPSDYDNPYLVTDDKDANDIESELNDDYDEYTEGEDDLSFNYDLTELSSYIKVKMEGENFKRDSDEWDDRDDNEFEDFVEDIAKLISDELDKDVKIYVYDRNDKTVGTYQYDDSKRKFEVISQYGEEVDLDDLEDSLEDEYNEYTEGSEDLEFSFSLSEKSSYIKVEMSGENFEADSSAWEDRDKSEFRDFAEDIAEEIYDAIDDMDVRIYIEDEDGVDTARYTYDEDDDEFDVDFEYGEDDDISAIENTLNTDYDTYDNDLEFEYEVTEDSGDIMVVMDATNFDKTSSDWEDRDKSDFRDFIEDIVEEVNSVIDDTDVNVFVYDEDEDRIGEYIYDESEDDFQVDYEYDE